MVQASIVRRLDGAEVGAVRLEPSDLNYGHVDRGFLRVSHEGATVFPKESHGGAVPIVVNDDKVSQAYLRSGHQIRERKHQANGAATVAQFVAGLLTVMMTYWH